MHNLKRDAPLYAVLLWAALFCAAAKAGTATITWTAPTICADGTALTNCPTSGYRIYGALQGQPKVLLASPAATSATATLTLGAGNQCFDMTTLSGANESAHSAESCKVVPAPLPNPPTIVTVATTVFNVIKSTDKLSLVAVGTVPLGVACSPTMGANGLRVVPRAQVTWTSTTHPLVVVADCG